MTQKTFLKYIFFDKKIVFIVFLLIVLSSVFAQAVPYLQGLIVDQAILTSSQKSLVIIMLAVVAILILDTFSRGYLAMILNSFSHKISGNIRRDVFAGILKKPLSFFEQKHEGEILQTTNAYLYYLGGDLAKGTTNIAIGASRFLIIFAFVATLNFTLGLILGGLYVAILVLFGLFAVALHKKSLNLRKNSLHRNSLILENLTGLETYITYGNGEKYLENYNKVNGGYGKLYDANNGFRNLITPLTDFLACLGTVIIYHIAFGDIAGLLEVGVLVSILSYASRATQPLEMIANGIDAIIEANSCVQIAQNFAETSADGTENLLDKTPSITCKNLCFKNSQGVEIVDFNIKIPFKSKVEIIGKSGLGKTAFSLLLAKIYKAEQGEILFGKQNINHLKREEISKIISVASDDVGIFEGTFLQNVHFADKSASLASVKKAIKQAGLQPFLSKYPQGASTKINEKSISEGEKQLIAFARVILKNTPIVIFDEFDRDLSPTLKKRFFKKLTKFTEDKTLIYITHAHIADLPFTKKVRF